MTSGLLRALTVAAIATGCLAGAVTAAVGASGSPAGQRPEPATDGRGFRYVGAFADRRWGGAFALGVWDDGTHVSFVGGIAPGPCEDTDFGATVPGRDGASGPRFYAEKDVPIGAKGTFRLAGRDRTVYSGVVWRSGPVTVTGTFARDVVRGRLQARITSRQDTCTASTAFTARRVREPRAQALGPVAPLPPGRPPVDERATYIGEVEGQVGMQVSLVVENGALLGFNGNLPGPCKRKKDGRTEFFGTPVSYYHPELPPPRLGDDGSFAVTDRQKQRATGPESVATVRGTFYGNTVRGWARARSGPSGELAGCRGEGRFWAKRND